MRAEQAEAHAQDKSKTRSRKTKSVRGHETNGKLTVTKPNAKELTSTTTSRSRKASSAPSSKAKPKPATAADAKLAKKLRSFDTARPALGRKVRNNMIRAERIARAMVKQPQYFEQYKREKREQRRLNWFESQLASFVENRVAHGFLHKRKYARR